MNCLDRLDSTPNIMFIINGLVLVYRFSLPTPQSFNTTCLPIHTHLHSDGTAFWEGLSILPKDTSTLNTGAADLLNKGQPTLTSEPQLPTFVYNCLDTCHM